MWIVLTPDGSRAALGAVRDHSAALREYFFDVVTEEEQQVLRAISERVLATIDPPICTELDDAE